MTRRELVVIVRDIGVGWVALTAQTLRAAGCAVGLVTTALSPSETARLDGLLDVQTVLDDVTDQATLVGAVRQLCTGRQLVAVLSSSDGVVVPAALAAEELGVGRSAAAALALARNKYAARMAMRAAGLPTPRFALLSGADDAAAVAAQVGLPAVIKPVNGTGSHLVEPVATVAELAAAYHRLADRVLATPQLRHIYARAVGGIDPARSFLVEGMLRGEEYCVDVLIRDGAIEQLPLVHKFLVDDRFFERGFVCPPLEMEPERERHIADCVDAALKTLGLDNTVAHVEVIDDIEAGPTIVEVNAGRPGGQVLNVLYQLYTGVNTGAELLSLTRGLPSDRGPAQLPIPLASLSLFPEQTGRLRAIRGMAEVDQLPDVINIIATVQPGDVVTSDYEMFAVNLIVAGFQDREDLLDTYHQANALVRFEVEPP